MAANKVPPRPSLIWTALKVLLALVLAVFIVSRTDLAALLGLQDRILPGWLTLVFVLFFVLTLLKAFQYYFLLGRKVIYPQVLRVVVVQNAISNFIATSAGIASYLSLFRVEHEVKLSRSTAAFLLAKMGDLISIWLLLIVSSISVWDEIGPIRLAVGVLIFGMGALLLVLLLLVVLRERFVGLLRRIATALRLERIKLIRAGLELLQDMAGQKQDFVTRTILVAVIFSLVYMGLTMAWTYASLRTFSLPVGLMPAVFANTFLQLVSYLPIQVFGGLGLTEVSTFYFFSFFHLPQAQLAAVLIGTRLLFYVENLVVLLYLPLYPLFSSRTGRAPGEP